MKRFIQRKFEQSNSSQLLSTLWVSVSSYLNQGMSLIVGFIAARYLGPELLGTWTKYKTIKSYLSYGVVGISDAMNKEVPFQRGKGEQDYADRISGNAFSLILINYSLVFVVALVICMMTNISQIERLCFLAVIMIFMLEAMTTFQGSYARSYDKFANLSFVNLLSTVVYLLNIPAILYFGIYGHLSSNVILPLVTLLLGHVVIKYRYNMRLEKKITILLLKSGLAMSSMNYAYILFTTSDRLLVITFFSNLDMGYYSLASIVAIPLTTFVQSFNSVIFITLNKLYGATGSREKLLAYIEQFMHHQQHLIPYLTGILIVLLPSVVLIALPNYTPGIRAAQIAVFGTSIYACTNPYTNLLVTINKRHLVAAILVVSGLSCIIAGYIIVQQVHAIEAVAMAMTISNLVYGALVIIFTYRMTGATVKVAIRKMMQVFGSIGSIGVILSVVEIVRVNVIAPAIGGIILTHLVVGLLFSIVALLVIRTRIRELVRWYRTQ